MRRLLLSVALILAAVPLGAQTIRVGAITTAGADCSTATRCLDVDVRGLTSFGVYLDVGTSGTFNWEASADATSPTSGTWVAITDDINTATTATADGLYVFTNPGYVRVRVRASAISGTATLTFARGFSGIRSASVSGVAAAVTVAQLPPALDANSALRVGIDCAGTPCTFTADSEHGQTAVNFGPTSIVTAAVMGAGLTPYATAAAVKQIADPTGVAWGLKGHPDQLTLSVTVADADGAQTNAALVTVGAGVYIVVTHAAAFCDGSNTGPINVLLGFGAATLTAASATGTTTLVLNAHGIVPGGGSPVLDRVVRGALGDDLRLTMEDPVGGGCDVSVTYYTVTP